MGTIVHEGAGHGVVVATGTATAFGGIAAGLAERATASAFQQGLSSFSTLLVRVAGVLTLTIFVFNIAFHKPILDALLFSLAIAVGITPELMPAIVTVGLSSGSRALRTQARAGQASGGHRGSRQHPDPLHRQDGDAHRWCDHVRPQPRLRRRALRRPTVFGLVCNESTPGRRRAGRGQRARPGAVGGNRSRRPSLLASTALGLHAGCPPALRSRTSACLSAGRRTGRPHPGDQRCARSRARAVHLAGPRCSLNSRRACSPRGLASWPWQPRPATDATI